MNWINGLRLFHNILASAVIVLQSKHSLAWCSRSIFQPLHKKWSFPLRISSINGKLHFLCSELFLLGGMFNLSFAKGLNQKINEGDKMVSWYVW